VKVVRKAVRGLGARRTRRANFQCFSFVHQMADTPVSVPSVLELARTIVAQAVRQGDTVVDATVGNGHDTLFLAECVGPSGQVYGFDVQEAAIAATQLRLRERALAERVHLHHGGHERMRDALPPDVQGRIRAVMFNLGYLPGAPEKTVMTRPETTLAALDAALDLLTPGGVITAVVYPAHEGGREEAEAVDQWAATRPRDRCRAYTYAPLNTLRPAPRLVILEKVAGHQLPVR